MPDVVREYGYWNNNIKALATRHSAARDNFTLCHPLSCSDKKGVLSESLHRRTIMTSCKLIWQAFPCKAADDVS